MKKLIALLLALVMALSLAACSTSEPTATEAPATDAPATEAPAAAEEPLKICFTANSLENETFVAAMDLMEATCAEKGWEFNKISYEGDVGKLNDTLENFITAGADVIIFQNSNSEAVADVINRAKEAGIVIVDYDSSTPVGDYYLDVSNEEIGSAIGEMGAAYAKEHFGENVQAVVSTFLTNEVLVVRSDSMAAKYQELGAGEVVLTLDPVNSYNRDYAALAENIHSAAPEAKIILTISDAQSVKEEDALKSLGYTEENMALFGCDCIDEVIDNWLAGEPTMIKGSIWLDFPNTMHEAFLAATNTALTGEYTESAIQQPVIAVTPDNVAEYFG